MAFASCTALAAFSAQPARAQLVDYGALEQLFAEPVTTSATGSPQRATDAPASMQIITADEIRRSGAYDIPGVLRQLVGIDVMRWSNDDADIGVRGYDQAFSPRVLVLVDGQQVYSDDYGFTPWSALAVEMSAIRQIEVTKGPNAALYGFNAANGVINIITYGPLYDDVNTLSVRGGTQGMADVSVVETVKFGDRGGVRISGHGHFDRDFATPVPVSAGDLARTKPDNFGIDLDGVFRLGDGIYLGLEASHSDGTSNDINPVYYLSRDRHIATSLKGQVTAETGHGTLQATVYKTWTVQSMLDPLHTRIHSQDAATFAEIQDLFRIGAAHTLRAALEYRYDTVNTTPFEGGRVYYSDYAASLMWDWSVLPTLSLTNALRWENLRLGRSGAVPEGYPFTNADWQRTLNEVSYNSGLVWRATENDTLRVLVSQGDQLPSLNSFGAFLRSSPFSNAGGAPDLDSTDVYNYEIDWDRSLQAIGGRFRAAAFYMESVGIATINGGIVPDSGPPPMHVSTEIGDSTAYGLELSLDGTFRTNWRWGASYRFEDIADSFIPSAANGASYADFEHVAPRHVVKANLGWASGDWEVDGYLYYQSATQGLAGLPFVSGSFLTPVNAYVAVDARIAYRPNDWATLAISGQNLLESPQQQTSGPAVERRVFATLTITY